MRMLVSTLLALLLLFSQPLHAQTCGTKRYCREMTSCVEARFYLEHCGVTRLDGDSDGSPCETLCGDGGNRAASKIHPPDITPLPELMKTGQPSCGTKTRCNQMQSCEEAKFFLEQCNVKSLDRNNDGVPCNALCGG